MGRRYPSRLRSQAMFLPSAYRCVAILFLPVFRLEIQSFYHACIDSLIRIYAMRLLDTTTLKLTYFTEGQQEPDAILSHTWGHEEVTHRDLEQYHDAISRQLPSADIISSRTGFQKIQGYCDQARRDGLRWAWVDTCCIDKTSSAELSESINSMSKWYRESDVCYAYLSDVPHVQILLDGSPGRALLSVEAHVGPEVGRSKN